MNNLNLSKLIRSDISEMEVYVPVASIWDLMEKYRVSEKEILKLDQGENPFVRGKNLFNYYPDPQYKKLRSAISKYVGLNMEKIMVGAGADELLDLILRLILNQGDEVISCPPTFGMYPVLIKLNKGTLVSVPRNNDFSLNMTAILKKVSKKTKAIFICSPNNPTGNSATKIEIITLLKTKKIIVVDEAYFEFCDKTFAPLISKYKNLIVLRTFSKWAGLAGLRLGYGLMDPFFVREFLKIKSPFNVNLAAEAAAIAAINAKSSAQKNIKTIINQRERVYKKLSALPYLTVYPSDANFLFIKVKKNFLQLKKYLEQKRIIVRYYGQSLRLSIGTPKQNSFVIKTFREVIPL